MLDLSLCYRYLVAGEGDEHVRVDKVLGLAGEGLLHVGHETRVHLGKPLCLEDLDDEARSLAVCWHAIG